MIVITVLGWIAVAWIACAIIWFIIGAQEDPSIFEDIKEDPIIILAMLCLWWADLYELIENKIRE
jgi:hypothetical protein